MGRSAPRLSQLVLPERPTAADLKAYLDGKAAAVAGRIVLVGAGTPVPVNFTKSPLRRDYDDLAAMFDPVNPRAPQFGPGRPAVARRRSSSPAASRRGRSTSRSTPSSSPTRRSCASTTPAAITARFAPSTTRPSMAPPRRPTMILRNEDFGRIAAAPGRWPPRRTRGRHRQSLVPRGADLLQRHRRDHRLGQGERGDHARRSSRLVACRDRRHRQRHRRGRDDGGGTHPQGAGREAAPDDPCRAVGRRGAGPARVEGLRRQALRHGRGADAGVRDLWRLPERRLGHRPRARRHGLRSYRGRPHPARDLRAVRRPRLRRRHRHEEPPHGRHRQHVVQRRRPARHRPHAGPDRVPVPHLAHQPRHLRARRRSGREEERGDDRVGPVPPRDA